MPRDTHTGRQVSEGDLELAGEFHGAFCELGEAIRNLIQSETRKHQERGRDKKSSFDMVQVIGHMDVMLANEALEVQGSASCTLAVLAESSPQIKLKETIVTSRLALSMAIKIVGLP